MSAEEATPMKAAEAEEQAAVQAAAPVEPAPVAAPAAVAPAAAAPAAVPAAATVPAPTSPPARSIVQPTTHSCPSSSKASGRHQPLWSSSTEPLLDRPQVVVVEIVLLVHIFDPS